MNKGDFHGAYFHCKFQQNRLDLLVHVRRVSAKHPNNNHSPSEADGISSLTKLLNSAERQLDPDDDVLDDELEKALLASPIQSFDPSYCVKRAKLNNDVSLPSSSNINSNTSINTSTTSSSSSTSTSTGSLQQQSLHSSPTPQSSSSSSSQNIGPSGQLPTNAGSENKSATVSDHGNGNAGSSGDGLTPLKPGTSTIQSAQNHGHKRVVIPGNTGTVPLPPHPFLLQQSANMNGGGSRVVRPRIPNNLPGILPDEPVSNVGGGGSKSGSKSGSSGMPTISIPQLHRGISQNTEHELNLMLASGQMSAGVSAPNSFSAMDSIGKPMLSRTGSDMWAQFDIEHANPTDSIIDDINFDEEGRNSGGTADDNFGIIGIASAPPSLSSPSIVPFSGTSPIPSLRHKKPSALASRNHANLHLLSTVAFHRSSSQESEGESDDNRLPVIEVKTLLSAEDEENQP